MSSGVYCSPVCTQLEMPNNSKGIVDLIGSPLWIFHIGFKTKAFQWLAHILNHYIVCVTLHIVISAALGIMCAPHPAVLLVKSSPTKQWTGSQLTSHTPHLNTASSTILLMCSSRTRLWSLVLSEICAFKKTQEFQRNAATFSATGSEIPFVLTMRSWM